MSIVTMVLGESGTGKSASLRNLDPADTLLIQAVKKPLPFRSGNWKRFDKEACPEGNIFQTDAAANIIALMQRTRRKVIVVDDFQYVMANEFMRRTDERGFDKFTEIGKNAWDILNAAASLQEDVRVYLLSHVETTESGRTKIKTIGKMLDEKITLEGMVTIVLRTVIRDGQYLFATRNNGSDTTKTPMGLFEQDLIDNDLAAVDQAIFDYYHATVEE
ncbi:AAA family ATPase [Bordetella genomosp. 9]|uniref:ATP-binding protein n=1 Tax=Bordetella genomosp. 9 TaxID=1416803 RepID=A0A1W6YYW2_9BORD|nr:AAA family ATPase [Bordetella genomosp. 9]ARP86268.1 ATP-binding protein [Bordetella genomosp. 9]